MKNKWIHTDNRFPDPGMVLIFDTQCLVTQAYCSGDSFHVPWGDEYPGSKQPKWWMPLPDMPS